MKITQKATAELGRHQLASTGSYTRGADDRGLSVNCRCGWHAEFDFSQLPDGEFNATPYIDGMIATHQIEKMEEA